MLTFDAPVPFSSMGRRNVSNVPAQSLILMNDPVVVEQAKRWAERVLKQGSNVEANIVWMYESAFARQPTEREKQMAMEFLGVLPAESNAGAITVERWGHFAHVLMNTKEFIFLR